MKGLSSRSTGRVIAPCLLVLLAGLPLGALRTTKAGKGAPRARAPSTDPQKFRLDNGFTVILLENHKEKKVAVESFYGAGFIHEPKGKPHISHVAEHMVVRCGTKQYEPNESVTLLQKKGMANAETLPTFVHYDYLLPSNELELALRIESERLTSVTFSEEVLKQEIPKCLREVDFVQKNPRAGLVKFGLVALCQTLNFGDRCVPVCAGTSKLTVKDVAQFHRDHYTPGNAFLIIVGDFDSDEAKKLVAKYFASVPKARPRTRPPVRIDEDIRANWDFASDAVYLVYPGAAQDVSERLVLTLFGNYLNGHLSAAAHLNKVAKVSFCSNQLYPVGALPFFVFAEAKQDQDIEQVENVLNDVLQNAINKFNVLTFSQTKRAFASFMRTTALERGFLFFTLKHEMLLAQEAINLGIKELLRNGLSHEEFLRRLDDLDFNTANKIIRARVSVQNTKKIIFLKARAQVP